MDHRDIEIEERFKRLKEPLPTDIPTEEELNQRLHKLKFGEASTSALDERLKRLKEPLPTDIPTEEELNQRLHKLKFGEASTSALTTPSGSKPYIVVPNPYVGPPKSNEEQANALMQEYMDAASLSRTETSGPSVNESNTDVPQKSETARLLEKILAEAALEKKTESLFPNIPTSDCEDDMDVEHDTEDADSYSSSESDSD